MSALGLSKKHLILAQQNHPNALLNFSNLADNRRAGFWRAGGTLVKRLLKPRGAVPFAGGDFIERTNPKLT
jgi:hypothetical protein